MDEDHAEDPNWYDIPLWGLSGKYRVYHQNKPLNIIQTYTYIYIEYVYLNIA